MALTTDAPVRDETIEKILGARRLLGRPLGRPLDRLVALAATG